MDSTVTFLLLTSGQTQSSTSTEDKTAQTDECHNPTQTASELQDQPASKKPSDPEVRSVGWPLQVKKQLAQQIKSLGRGQQRCVEK